MSPGQRIINPKKKKLGWTGPDYHLSSLEEYIYLKLRIPKEVKIRIRGIIMII